MWSIKVWLKSIPKAVIKLDQHEPQQICFTSFDIDYNTKFDSIQEFQR